MASVLLHYPSPNDGLSAYEIWLNNGNLGTEQQFLEWLKGEAGASAYEIWLSNGNTGSQADFLHAIKGANGDSAYQVWLNNGHTGTEAQFLSWLQGNVSGIGALVDWNDMGLNTAANHLTTATGKYSKIGKVVTISGIVTGNDQLMKVKLPFKPMYSYSQEFFTTNGTVGSNYYALLQAGNQFMQLTSGPFPPGAPVGINLTYITSE